jgi:hypothetical protein
MLYAFPNDNAQKTGAIGLPSDKPLSDKAQSYLFRSYGRDSLEKDSPDSDIITLDLAA